jgi:peptide/nickel transport system ATP-binding protein
MSDAILEVRNLQVQFRTDHQPIQAVDGISFEVKRGQTLGIVGESGSGKSVTSLAVMGLVPSPPGKITQGEIWFQEGSSPAVDLRQLPQTQLQGYRGSRIAMIFQEPMSSLNPVYTCGFQLIEAIRQHQDISPEAAQQQAIARLQEVKLLPSDEEMLAEIEATGRKGDRTPREELRRRQQQMLDRYPHELSGGQSQRVVIAMAIAGNPSLLIADEPTTALDVTVQATILDLLRELRDRRGMSMIFITHDLGIIAEIADQVAVMYRGKIVESGPVTDIFARPQQPYTQGLLACRPQPSQRLRYLPTVADFLRKEAQSADVPSPDPAAPANSMGVPVEDPVDRPLGDTITVAETQERLAQLIEKSPLVSVRNLQVGYPVRGVLGRTQRHIMAVDDLSFDIYPGETFGLVGESGCGKTTLGRSLLRLVPAMGGQVLFEGRDVLKLRGQAMRRLRRDMQIIFQDPFSALDPRMGVGAAIAEPLQIHGLLKGKRNLRERVAYLLERVGLSPESMNRFPHEFSGGQRQRICIARALALNPKFIICDESVSSLDVSVQAQVLNLLKALQAEFNLTYIFISHDLGVVKFMSDRIMVMNRGKIEEIGPADQIYQQPQQPYTQKLIDAIPSGSLARIEELQAQRLVTG